MPEEPTLGEVLRRLNEYVEQQAKIIDRLDRMVSDNAATYVRQDVYVAQRLADQTTVANFHQDIGTVRAEVERDITAIKEERTADLAFRRQVMLALAGVAIASLVSIAIAIINTLAR